MDASGRVSFANRSADEILGFAAGTGAPSSARVFAKTDTRRQSDLVRRLLTAPGELRPQEPDPKPGRAGKKRRKR